MSENRNLYGVGDTTDYKTERGMKIFSRNRKFQIESEIKKNKRVLPNYVEEEVRGGKSDKDKLKNNEKRKIWCDKNACHNMQKRKREIDFV